jgi:hypothetical protein
VPDECPFPLGTFEKCCAAKVAFNLILKKIRTHQSAVCIGRQLIKQEALFNDKIMYF